MQTVVTVQPEDGTLLVPTGITTPHCDTVGCKVTGAAIQSAHEVATGQTVLLAEPVGLPIRIRYRHAPGTAYPDALFTPRDSHFTRATDALRQEAEADAGRPIAWIATRIARLFAHGHPETRFYDDAPQMPQLCGLTEGSCVDIGLYFIATLRAAGYEAGYVTGYFFPAEKGDRCDDMHGWVVTRQNGTTQEWDIAHHLEMGRTEIAPGLDPKPGRRVPIAHSLGLTLPALGLTDLERLGEPLWLRDGTLHPATLDIRLEDG